MTIALLDAVLPAVNVRDFLVYVCASAIPKDSPSAGGTIALALVSALSGRPIRAGLTATGEITLRLVAALAKVA